MNSLRYEMLRIRMIEERIAREYPKGKMRCPVHLSIGQEAPAVCICYSIRPTDRMVSTHRGHAHYLAKGGSLKGLIGELYGKSTGCSRGNGGSMHLIDLHCGFYGSTSIVGGTIPVGVGLAFADRLKDFDNKTVICIGDAAIEEGVFHEAANFASLHRLNVIFFCENNLYSCYTHINDRQPWRSMESVAKAHKLEYLRLEENQFFPFEVCDGPCFVEAPTYRHVQHCGPEVDDHLGYRSLDEIEYWKGNDPVVETTSDHIKKITQEIDEAFADAEAAPFPDESEIGKYVYAPSDV